MRSWIKFVALLMLAFVLFDVCTPESCEAQILTPVQSQAQVLTQPNPGGGETCQFEEDCFSCAHYEPGTMFVFHSVAMVSFTAPDLFVPLLDGTPLIPYHPPRA
jgi:hypothetical protein